MDFKFESIKPKFDVICVTYENNNKAILEFSDNELMQQVVAYLLPQNFISCIIPVGKDMIGIQIKDTFDSLQVLERICTTLELHHKSVNRKLIPVGKYDKDVAPIQSYLL